MTKPHREGCPCSGCQGDSWFADNRAPSGAQDEYYYRVNGCSAETSNDSECVCWHKAGTGPFPDARPGDGNTIPRTWRPASAHPQDDRAALVERLCESLRFSRRVAMPNAVILTEDLETVVGLLSAPAEGSEPECAECGGSGYVYLPDARQTVLCGHIQAKHTRAERAEPAGALACADMMREVIRCLDSDVHPGDKLWMIRKMAEEGIAAVQPQREETNIREVIDPSLPPGVVEFRDGDRVLGRIEGVGE